MQNEDDLLEDNGCMIGLALLICIVIDFVLMSMVYSLFRFIFIVPL